MFEIDDISSFPQPEAKPYSKVESEYPWSCFPNISHCCWLCDPRYNLWCKFEDHNLHLVYTDIHRGRHVIVIGRPLTAGGTTDIKFLPEAWETKLYTFIYMYLLNDQFPTESTTFTLKDQVQKKVWKIPSKIQPFQDIHPQFGHADSEGFFHPEGCARRSWGHDRWRWRYIASRRHRDVLPKKGLSMKPGVPGDMGNWNVEWHRECWLVGI